MLKGANTMELNQATMIAALQHYFTTKVFAEGSAPTVKSIAGVKPNGYGGGETFTVALEAATQEGTGA